MNTKYFNNAGAGIVSEKTMNTIVEHMRLETSIGAYQAALTCNDSIHEFYTLGAKLLNANSYEEIAYIDSASRGWNLVMYGLKLNKEDTIVTLASEYGTNLLTIYDISKKTGCSVNVLPCEPDGRININTVDNALANGGTVLAVSHVAAQGSIINPVVDFGEIAQKHRSLYIVDGCQAVGQIHVDVQKINCDAYITAGRKWLRGPRGTGILYVRANAPIRTPQIDLASADLIFDKSDNVIGVHVRKDAKQFELWEKSISLLMGLSNAIREYLEYGVDKASIEISSKANIIRECIDDNKSLILVGEKIAPVGAACFYMREPDREDEVKSIFEKNGFIISCMCDWDCPIFFPRSGVQYIFRITPHYYTRDEDIKSICKLISSL